MKSTWEKIPCSFSDLNLEIVLKAGQSFRWHKKSDGEWQGVLHGRVWNLKQDSEGNLLYIVHNFGDQNDAKREVKAGNCTSLKTRSSSRIKSIKQLPYSKASTSDVLLDSNAILKDYFQLHIDLKALYDQWNIADTNFKLIARNFPGVRILKQDPTENLFSFICSSNNNIQRITGMVEKLCSKYGKEIGCKNGVSYYAFPSIEALADSNVEEDLRNLGFGYRAKFINQAAKHILEKCPPGWLESLRRLSYKEAHSSLIQIPGVGAKVADCVSLMSLDKTGAIPVDTHVWQITVRDYLPHLKNTKSLTDRVYQEVGDFYRKQFGEYAGWANTVLFAADLRQFKHLNES